MIASSVTVYNHTLLRFTKIQNAAKLINSTYIERSRWHTKTIVTPESTSHINTWRKRNCQIDTRSCHYKVLRRTCARLFSLLRKRMEKNNMLNSEIYRATKLYSILTYMVRPRFPDKSPKFIFLTPLFTAFWKTPANQCSFLVSMLLFKKNVSALLAEMIDET